MKTGYCILVFGVSGVGKSTACAEFAKLHPEYLYARASALLSEAVTTHPEALRTASEQSIIQNQNLLGPALSRLREGQTGRPVLLDAHAVIDNDDGIIRVPLRVIEDLLPSGFVLLEATPEEVASRRALDRRNRPARSVAEIERELEAEREAVRSYSRALRLPLEAAHVAKGFSLEKPMAALICRVGSSP